MSYHETGDGWGGSHTKYMDEKERPVGAIGKYIEHPADPVSERPVTLKGVEGLKEDYREIKREAKSEYKQAKEVVARLYAEKLDKAKREYLEESISLRERFQNAREAVKEEYQAALDTAKNDYELTVDIAKDQYKNLRKETTKMIKKGKKTIETVLIPEPEAKIESAPTRVIMRLDEEIRKVSAKKAETEMAGRKDTAAIAGRLEIG